MVSEAPAPTFVFSATPLEWTLVIFTLATLAVKSNKLRGNIHPILGRAAPRALILICQEDFVEKKKNVYLIYNLSSMKRQLYSTHEAL